MLRANSVYTLFWLIMEIPCFIFKYHQFNYSSSGFGLEFAILFVVALNDFVRHYFGIRGNRLLNTSLMATFIIYGLFCAAGFVFFLILQSYTQRIEVILSGIALLLIVVELLLTIVTMIRARRPVMPLTQTEQIQRYEKTRERVRSAMNMN